MRYEGEEHEVQSKYCALVWQNNGDVGDKRSVKDDRFNVARCWVDVGQVRPRDRFKYSTGTWTWKRGCFA